MGNLGLLLFESFVSIYDMYSLFNSLDNIPKEQWDLICGGEWGK